MPELLTQMPVLITMWVTGGIMVCANCRHNNESISLEIFRVSFLYLGMIMFLFGFITMITKIFP